jgi:hypothetical protein
MHFFVPAGFRRFYGTIAPSEFPVGRGRVLWNKHNRTITNFFNGPVFFLYQIEDTKKRLCPVRLTMDWGVGTAYRSCCYKHKHRFSGFVIKVQV